MQTCRRYANVDIAAGCPNPLPTYYALLSSSGLTIALGAVYTRVFCVRFSVRDGAAAPQFPLLFSRDHVREKQRKLLGGGAITDGTTDAKIASVDGP
jgi:hypothetical protein